MPYSKEKRKEYDKKYYELNTEKRAEYYQLNKEKIRECGRRYRELNKEKIREKKAEYRRVNKEKISEYNKKYYDKNKAYCIEYLGGKCVKCGDIHNLQFDHIKREGKKYEISRRVHQDFIILKEELDKCQLLCPLCHLDKTASEWTK
jgi:5-methylcytosine-specific restriction endonuclease McrA